MISSMTPRAWLALAIGGVAILVGDTALAIAKGLTGAPADGLALLFVGLLALVTIGLLVAAETFNRLGYSGLQGDAFALPTGSTRALLAFALMILLIVFGLPLAGILQASKRIAAQPMQTV